MPASPPPQVTDFMFRDISPEPGDYLSSLETIDLGAQPFPSGSIVACDPLTLCHDGPFERGIAPGSYPVRLCLARLINGDERIAAAAIILEEDVVPSEWVMATVAGQELSTLGADEVFGYGVDSGTGGFFDAAFTTVLNMEAVDRERLENVIEKINNRIESTWRDTRGWAMSIEPEPDGVSVSAFSSGFGDGFYPSYWGSAEGEPCCLLTDFEVLGDT